MRPFNPLWEYPTPYLALSYVVRCTDVQHKRQENMCSPCVINSGRNGTLDKKVKILTHLNISNLPICFILTRIIPKVGSRLQEGQTLAWCLFLGFHCSRDPLPNDNSYPRMKFNI